MNNAAFWGVVEDYLSRSPKLSAAPFRVTLEHLAPIALGTRLEIITHRHPAGSTDEFGPGLHDRDVTTLTFCVSHEAKAAAAIVALQKSRQLTRPAVVSP
jgi:acyl-ACP thioesterase